MAKSLIMGTIPSNIISTDADRLVVEEEEDEFKEFVCEIISPNGEMNLQNGPECPSVRYHLTSSGHLSEMTL